MLSPELKGIRDKYTTLASTGCTTEFCQAGRLRRKGMVFVCASGAAAEGAKSMFESILGGTVGEVLGGRYIEEVF